MMDSNDIIGLLERSKSYYFNKIQGGPHAHHVQEEGTTFVFFHGTPLPQYNSYKITNSGWTCIGTEFVGTEGKSWGTRGSLL